MDSAHRFWHRLGTVVVLASLLVLPLGVAVEVPAHARERAARKQEIQRILDAQLPRDEQRAQLREASRQASRHIGLVPIAIFTAGSLATGLALRRQACRRAAVDAQPTPERLAREHWTRLPGVRYATFWPRFWAGFLDSFVLAPLTVLFLIVRPTPGTAPDTLHTLLQNAIFYGYTLWLLTTRGQTAGKWLCRVQVLAVNEEPMRPWQPWARDAVPIALNLLTLPLLAAHPHDPRVAMLASLPLTLWFVLELVTMLSNWKRRALHDYMARTVVVRVAD